MFEVSPFPPPLKKKCGWGWGGGGRGRGSGEGEGGGRGEGRGVLNRGGRGGETSMRCSMSHVSDFDTFWVWTILKWYTESLDSFWPSRSGSDVQIGIDESGFPSRFFSIVPFYPCFGEGSPTKMGYRKTSGTLVPTSLPEDLDGNPGFNPNVRSSSREVGIKGTRIIILL